MLLAESWWTEWYIFCDADAICGLRALGYGHSPGVLRGRECDGNDISIFSYTKGASEHRKNGRKQKKKKPTDLNAVGSHGGPEREKPVALAIELLPHVRS